MEKFDKREELISICKFMTKAANPDSFHLERQAEDAEEILRKQQQEPTASGPLKLAMSGQAEYPKNYGAPARSTPMKQAKTTKSSSLIKTSCLNSRTKEKERLLRMHCLHRRSCWTPALGLQPLLRRTSHGSLLPQITREPREPFKIKRGNLGKF